VAGRSGTGQGEEREKGVAGSQRMGGSCSGNWELKSGNCLLSQDLELRGGGEREGREGKRKKRARKGKERGCRCLLRSEVQSVGSTSVPPHGISAGGTMRTYGTSASLH
jgi:hypothetical protein